MSTSSGPTRYRCRSRRRFDTLLVLVEHAGRAVGKDELMETAAKANAALARALRLDDALAELHAAMGFLRSQCEYRWADAEQAFDRALELNAN
jgi:hypothetical protein